MRFELDDEFPRQFEDPPQPLGLERIEIEKQIDRVSDVRAGGPPIPIRD
jgi:hypothetical protein